MAAVSQNDAWTGGYDSSAHPIITHYLNGAVRTYTPTDAIVPYDPNILVISDSDVWFFGNAEGSAFLMHWNGTTWTQISDANAPDGTPVLLNAAAARGSNDIWFGGNNGHLVIEHWNGHVFKVVAVSPYILNGNVADVLEFSQSDVWFLLPLLVAGGAQIAVAHWDGTNLHFHVLSTPGRFALASQLAATSPTDIWALGDSATPGAYDETPQIWHFDGSWQPYAISTVPPNTAFSGIVAFRANDAVAVGANVGEPLTYARNSTSRWHQITNDLPIEPLGKASLVPGTRTFWQVTGDGDHATLVSCT
ncbi:MAG: hypothetical protein JO165_01535 [Candidatus Eremiobacteraeota bacterium]|nr:hypothetical protein [Candidatus Eremiobacteraeota bacterium]